MRSTLFGVITSNKEKVEVVLHPEISKWRDDRIDPELRKNIQEKGQLQNLVLRKLPDGKLQLISGHRRYKELQALGVPFEKMEKKILENVSDEDALLMAYSENRYRRDLSPLEEARALQSMKKTLKLLPSDIAVKVGRSESYVRERLALLDMPLEIQKLIMADKLPYAYSNPLRKLEGNSEMQLTLAKQIVKDLSDSERHGYYSDGIKTVKDAEKAVENILAEKKHKEELIAAHGSCPKCNSTNLDEGYQKNHLQCKSCGYNWNSETKDPWELYELKVMAEKMGLKLDLEGDKAKVIALLEQESTLKREKGLKPNFRCKVTVDDLLMPLIRRRVVMSFRVDGDHLEVSLIQDTGLYFSARKHDYNTGEKTQVRTGYSYGADEDSVIQKTTNYVESLGTE